MSTGAAIAVGAVTGLALGIIVSLATDIPLAPELGLVLGGLAGWLARRDRGRCNARAAHARARGAP